MATFDTPWQVSRPVPAPQTGVATYRPQLDDGLAAQAQYEAGRRQQEFAAQVDRVAQTLDETAAQDALNRLRQKRQELTLGEDGFTKLKGGDVMGKPGEPSVLDRFSERMRQATEEVSAGLISPRAKALFSPHAASETTGFQRDVLTHVAGQSEVYEKGVAADTQLRLQTEASQKYADPAALDALADQARTAAQTRARQLGIPGDAMAAAAASNVYVTGIKSLVAAGASRQALAMFEQHQDKLDANDRVQLGQAMKTIANGVKGEDLLNSTLAAQGLPAAPSDDTSSPAVVTKVNLHRAIIGQESGGRQFTSTGAVLTSPKGAQGAGQIIPATFARFAKPGERIDNEKDNLAVSKRMTDYYLDQYGGDWQRAAVAYFSGEGNVAPPGSPVPWKTDASDGGKRVSQYVREVGARMGQQVGGAKPPNWTGEGDSTTPAGFAGPAFKGDLKAGYARVQQAILDDPNAPPEVKAVALGLAQKHSSQQAALNTASVQSLDDQVRATQAVVALSPASLKPGTFAAFADRYEALGQSEKATRYRILAALEPLMQQGLGSMPDDALRLVAAVSEGLPKQIVETEVANRTKGRGEALASASEKFSQLRKSIETDGVPAAGLVNLAKEAASQYRLAGKDEEARKVYEYMDSAKVTADVLAKGGTAGLEQFRADLRNHAAKGEAQDPQLQALSFVTGMISHSREALRSDALANGSTMFGLGPVPALMPKPGETMTPEQYQKAMQDRVAMAREISDMGQVEAIPFTATEMQDIKAKLDAAPPQVQADTLRNLGRTIKDGTMLQRVASHLAGKDASDPISRSYAASMLMFADGDPARDQTADRILRGTAIRKSDDAGGRKAATQSDAWLNNWQDQTSTALLGLDTEARKMITDAVTSYYTWSMHQAGRQGEKLDTDMMNAAIKAVVGEPVTVRGQPMIPPRRGMSQYDVLGVIDKLQASDFPAGMKTLEGDEIKVDTIKQIGRFQNVGEGVYKVLIPDPRGGGVPREIEDPTSPPNKKRAVTIDLRPAMDRWQALGARSALDPENEQKPTGMRRRPVLPTLNDVTP